MHSVKYNNTPKIHIDAVTYGFDNSDSIAVDILTTVPLKFFVFEKKNNEFLANINYTLIASDKNTKAIVKRISETISISVPYYEDTRDNQQSYQIETKINLPPSLYVVLCIVEDIDSHQIFKKEITVDLKDTLEISDLRAYYSDGNNLHYINKIIREDIDSIWLKLQVTNVDSLNDNVPFLYKVLKDTSIIDSQEINLVKTEQNFYSIPISIDSEWEGDFKFFIGHKGVFSSIDLFIVNKKSTQLWSTNLNEILGVMEYLLSYSEIKKINKMLEADALEYVENYWHKLDPTPTTDKNELLQEFNYRIKYANSHFSIIGKGWRSDMGRVYIINGAPDRIDRQYNPEYSYNYEVWYYSNGRRFTFSDYRNFGEMKLVEEF